MIFPKTYNDIELTLVDGKKIFHKKLSQFNFDYYVLIFYPLDFTFVCPTELQAISKLKEKFDELKAAVFFISADSPYSHLTWQTMENGIGQLNFPMISDMKHELSSQFQLFNEETGTVFRSTVILNSSFETVHLSANIDPIGRSTKEILRILRALTSHKENGEICGVDFDEEDIQSLKKVHSCKL